jgi:hypothetical protein
MHVVPGYSRLGDVSQLATVPTSFIGIFKLIEVNMLLHCSAVEKGVVEEMIQLFVAIKKKIENVN